MGILKRVRDITLANVNSFLDQLEDPNSMIEQYIRDLENEIINAEQAISDQYVLEKEHEYLISYTDDFISKRLRQTQLAVETGNDAIAKQALNDKISAEKKLQVYRAQYDTIQEQLHSLQVQLNELREKHQELLNKKHGLVSRANVAKTTKQIQTTLSSGYKESALRGFERMEERIRTMEAEAYASVQNYSHHKTSLGNLHAVTQEELEQELEKIKSLNADKTDSNPIV